MDLKVIINYQRGLGAKLPNPWIFNDYQIYFGNRKGME
jgi:hypothetical protein